MQPYRFSDIQAKPTFAQAAEVIEQMGLVPITETQCKYNVPLLLQFFSTLVIESDIPRTMKWMSGRTFCTSSFRKFADLLGYPYGHDAAVGHRMHQVDPLNKNLMKDLYGAGAVVGKNKGLLPMYD